MKRNLSLKFWIESTLAVVTAGLTLLTYVWPDWIEGIVGFDPDEHSGSTEWGTVIVFALATVLFSALARHEWTKARSAGV